MAIVEVLYRSQEITPLSQHIEKCQEIFDLSSRHGKVRFGLGFRTYSVSLRRGNRAVREICEKRFGSLDGGYQPRMW
jgi:hypothetical protein